MLFGSLYPETDVRVFTPEHLDPRSVYGDAGAGAVSGAVVAVGSGAAPATERTVLIEQFTSTG